MTDNYRGHTPLAQTGGRDISKEIHNKRMDNVQQALLIFFGIIIMIVVLRLIFTGKVKLW